MKTIKLTQGKVALVDDEDFEELSKHVWRAHRNGRTSYAIRDVYRQDGKRTTERMHRAIMGVTDPRAEVDHRDLDGLNCQRYNLRECTHRQNLCNTRTHRDSATGLKGVYRKGNIFVARIALGDRRIWLGTRTTPEAAHALYREAAIRLHGEFARIDSTGAAMPV